MIGKGAQQESMAVGAVSTKTLDTCFHSPSTVC